MPKQEAVDPHAALVHHLCAAGNLLLARVYNLQTIQTDILGDYGVSAGSTCFLRFLFMLSFRLLEILHILSFYRSGSRVSASGFLSLFCSCLVCASQPASVICMCAVMTTCTCTNMHMIHAEMSSKDACLQCKHICMPQSDLLQKLRSAAYSDKVLPIRHPTPCGFPIASHRLPSPPIASHRLSLFRFVFDAEARHLS